MGACVRETTYTGRGVDVRESIKKVDMKRKEGFWCSLMTH